MIRLITFSSYRSNAEKLYAQLKILNLDDIYKLQIAKLMHKFSMTAYHLFSTIYSQSWTRYIHIILDRKYLKNI